MQLSLFAAPANEPVKLVTIDKTLKTMGGFAPNQFGVFPKPHVKHLKYYEGLETGDIEELLLKGKYPYAPEAYIAYVQLENHLWIVAGGFDTPTAGSSSPLSLCHNWSFDSKETAISAYAEHLLQHQSITPRIEKWLTNVYKTFRY